jgi:hypothetical protein
MGVCNYGDTAPLCTVILGIIEAIYGRLVSQSQSHLRWAYRRPAALFVTASMNSIRSRRARDLFLEK